MNAWFHVEHRVLSTTNQQLNSHRSCDRTELNQLLIEYFQGLNRRGTASREHNGSTRI